MIVSALAGAGVERLTTSIGLTLAIDCLVPSRRMCDRDGDVAVFPCESLLGPSRGGLARRPASVLAFGCVRILDVRSLCDMFWAQFPELTRIRWRSVPIRTAGAATRLVDESSARRSSGGGNLGVAGDRAAVHHGGRQGPLSTCRER